METKIDSEFKPAKGINDETMVKATDILSTFDSIVKSSIDSFMEGYQFGKKQERLRSNKKFKEFKKLLEEGK